MTNKDKAVQALHTLREVIAAEVTSAGPQGLRNSEVAQRLELHTNVNGGQRNHLTHALLNQLVIDGTLTRRAEGKAIFYFAA